MFIQMVRFDLGEFKNRLLSYFAMKPPPPLSTELQKLRQQVVTDIRSNQHLEADLSQMDIKIGLLVKNRITLQVRPFILLYHLYSCIIYTLVSFILLYHLCPRIIYTLVSVILSDHLYSRISYTLRSFRLSYQLYSCIIYTLVTIILSYQLYSHISYTLVSVIPSYQLYSRISYTLVAFILTLISFIFLTHLYSRIM